MFVKLKLNNSFLLNSCCKCSEYRDTCMNHCLNNCPDQKIFHGRMLYLEGSLNRARANVSCDGGFHISGKSTCMRTETVYCKKSRYGSEWRSSNGSLIPKCERMGERYTSSFYVTTNLFCFC